MVNTEYGKVKLSLTLHFNEYNKFRLLLDGKEPMNFENTGKAINYVFETEVGNHILTFESIPFEKNQLGKLKFSFLSESFQKRILNHLFAFRYDLSCFKVIYMLHIHRNAKLEITIKTSYYNNFLYIGAKCLHPVIVQSSNIKVRKEEFSVLYNKLLKKKFYFSQMVIWTIYFILLITVFGGLAIYDIIHWEAGAYMAGFNKISALFLGVFPPLIMILFSYFFCIVNLVKQYNNNYLCE